MNNEFNIYRRAEKKVQLKLAVEIHTLIFIIVNICLILINLLFTPYNWWSIIVLLSWGLGYVIHSTVYFVKSGKKIALLIHLWSFLFVETMLILINLAYPTEVYWFVYPLIAFSISITIHAFFHIHSIKEKDIDEGTKTWYVKRIEKQAMKMKKELEGN